MCVKYKHAAYETINDPTTSNGSSAGTGIEPARIHTVKRTSTQC